jgi:hypothetical protein
MVLARFAAAVGGVALANWLKWGRVDGGNNVPFGAIRLDDDKDGKSRYFDVLGLLNVSRGARATGVRAVAEGLRRGDRPAEIVDAAVKDARNAFASPFEGPIVHTAFIASSGFDPSGFDVAGRAGVGESQYARNLKAAAQQFNPLVNKALGGKGGDQLGRFAVKTGRPDESVAVIQARKTLARNPYTRTPEQQARHDARQELVRRIRANPGQAPTLLARAVKDNVIPRGEVKEVRREAERSDLQNMVENMSPEDTARIYSLGTPQEKGTLAEQLRSKILRSTMPDAEQDRMLQQAGLTPPPDLALNRELRTLNQQAADSAEGRERARALMRQASGTSDATAAVQLRRQADEVLQATRMPDPDAGRRRQLQAIHERIGQIRKRVQEGSLGAQEGEGMIRRLLQVAARKQAA